MFRSGRGVERLRGGLLILGGIGFFTFLMLVSEGVVAGGFVGAGQLLMILIGIYVVDAILALVGAVTAKGQSMGFRVVIGLTLLVTGVVLAGAFELLGPDTHIGWLFLGWPFFVAVLTLIGGLLGREPALIVASLVVLIMAITLLYMQSIAEYALYLAPVSLVVLGVGWLLVRADKGAPIAMSHDPQAPQWPGGQ